MVLEQNSELPLPQRSRIISSVLSPAIRLWLRSQVEAAENLSFQIEGGDRQILRGHLPQVSVAAENVIYQGLSLSQVRLAAEEIRVNLGQVLKGKPLRLLQVVPVRGEIVLRQTDLDTSLQTSLLGDAVTDFLIGLLRQTQALPPEVIAILQNPSAQLKYPQIDIAQHYLRLVAQLEAPDQPPLSIAFRTGLHFPNGHSLTLTHPQWLLTPHAEQGTPLTDLDGFSVNLGSEVDIQELAIEPGVIICRGRINVIPGDE